MLGIKVDNEFLDLPADISLEMDRNNPFLSQDSIDGQYSLGLTIRYSETNYRLLAYTGNFTKPNKKYTVDASIYDDGLFRYGGSLVITQHNSNLNNIEETVWSGFFTIGSSSFLQSIQDVLLQDIDLGGDRSFPWTTTDPTDGSGGFWQHYHAARTPDAFPYTFYPIVDGTFDEPGFAPDLYTWWMNKLDTSNNFEAPIGDTYFDLEHGNAISCCPAIYLKFILESIFAQYGWKLAGEITEDTGYQKLTVPSFTAINWTDYKTHLHSGSFPYNFYPFDTITFNLADHVPQDYSVGSLIVNIKNRMGWWFDFDSNTKTAYLRGYQSIIDGTVKDWTKYVQAGYQAEYSDVDKIYSLVNNIDSADSYPTLKHIDESIVTNVDTFADLPTADDTQDGNLGFVYQENVYYVCRWNGSTNVWEWVFYSDNVGDYTPTGTNDKIESDISTMPSTLQLVDGRNVLVPHCNEPGNYYKKNAVSTFSIRFLFYHGMFPDSGGVNYPLASCTNQAISGTPTGDWVLPYRHEYGAVNNGTYDTWWKAWLKIIAIQDVRTMVLALPINELKNFSFSDIIFINNIFFIAQSAKEMLPYKGLIEMKLKRIY